VEVVIYGAWSCRRCGKMTSDVSKNGVVLDHIRLRGVLAFESERTALVDVDAEAAGHQLLSVGF
jgi:hypothetical protein